MDALRNLWWTDRDFTNSPEEFCKTAHLFGATFFCCATFALIRTIKHNKVSYDKDIYDIATSSVNVDDYLISIPNIKTIFRKYTQLKCMLLKGGSNLT